VGRGLQDRPAHTRPPHAPHRRGTALAAPAARGHHHHAAGRPDRQRTER
jgi:hypothetical protein